jgi:hypothetical protein
MVFLDGAYQTVGAAAPVFRPVAAPESSDLQQLVEQIAGRIGRALERRGLLERDLENAWLAADTEAGPLDDLLGHSITYRIAVGPRAGQKLFALQTVAPRLQGPEGEPNGAARAGGFSLHAGVDIAPNEREKLERLCRYVSRPPVASERLALTASGQVRYTLKTPYRDGTTHIVLAVCLPIGAKRCVGDFRGRRWLKCRFAGQAKGWRRGSISTLSASGIATVKGRRSNTD